MKTLLRKLRLYVPLIKSAQTALLLTTGLAGYLSAATRFSLPVLLGLAGSLALAISGSTILNMWYDHDIDARMGRTHKRPAASGALSQHEVLAAGVLVSAAGLAWSLAMQPLYALIVLAGWFFDVLVYTVWLKRRTCWAIVWGGVSGAMPILAGRVLATGQLDLIGLLLALSILCWIPTHILTFSIKYLDDYNRAGVPTFPARYGEAFTRLVIAASSVLAALAVGGASVLIHISAGYLRLMAVLAAGLLLLAFATFRVQSERSNFALFKYASLYMVSTMLILAAHVF